MDIINIEPTKAGRQFAADLSNAIRTKKGFPPHWEPRYFDDKSSSDSQAFARLATEWLARDEADKARDAELTELRAGMAELWELLSSEDFTAGRIAKAVSIAARHRPKPVDPLVKAWETLWPEDTGIPGACAALRAELAKHGVKIGEV